MRLTPPNENLRITGEKIFLRPITEADTEQVLRWRNAERTRSFFYYREIISREEHLRWLREKVGAGLVHQFVVCLKEATGELPAGMGIGCVYLQRPDPGTKSMESGVFMGEEAPGGMGLASEAVRLLNSVYAFEHLHLHSTIARVLGFNEASKRVHEKAGFTLAQVREKDACFDGRWEDTYVYRMDNPGYEVPYVGISRNKGEKVLYVQVPGSKSITNRGLLLAMLARGESVLEGVLFSDDSRHFLSCVKALGLEVSYSEEEKGVRLTGLGGELPLREASLYVGSAGTAARFLAATLAGIPGTWHMDSSEQMKRRPMEPLLSSLQELGIQVDYEGEPGHFPFTLKSHGFQKNRISINIDKSSQFLSALLIASVLGNGEFETDVTGSHGMAYITMTQKMMEQFGVRCLQEGSTFHTAGGRAYSARQYRVEPDASAAAYFYALGAILGRQVCVENVHFGGLQGDTEFLHLLEKMGCSCRDTERGILLLPPADGKLHGIRADMSACSDQAITMAAIAPFADGPVEILGIGHIRLQESDRLLAIHTELQRMGIHSEMGEDSILIYPGKPKPARIETYGDHRIAMGFALTGLRAEGITILDPSCCRKTFENYFALLDDVIAQIRRE